MGKDYEYCKCGRGYKSNLFVNNNQGRTKEDDRSYNYRKQRALLSFLFLYLPSKFLHDLPGGRSLATDPFDLYK